MINRNKTDVAREKYGNYFYINLIGYPIINRDSWIINHVYVPASNSPPILVSDNGKLIEVYNDVKEKVELLQSKSGVLNIVYETVKSLMKNKPSDENESIIKKIENPDREFTYLNEYLSEGVGVCKHFALASAALLELLRMDGLINGHGYVRRQVTEHGGHAWCTYVNSGGDEFVIDVGLEVLARMSEARKYYPYY